MIASVGILLTFVLRVARRLDEAGIGRIAASLSFTTLLGLVPLFTVAFAYVARYSAFQSWVDGLEPFLLRYLLPGSSNTVRRYLAEFTTNTANLKGFAIGFVVLTAVLLVAEVEREINVIWGIETPRSFMRRVVVYSLGLVAAPILIGGTAYATSWLIAQSIAAVPMAGDALTLLADSGGFGRRDGGLDPCLQVRPSHTCALECGLARRIVYGSRFRSGQNGLCVLHQAVSDISTGLRRARHDSPIVALDLSGMDHSACRRRCYRHALGASGRRKEVATLSLIA